MISDTTLGVMVIPGLVKQPSGSRANGVHIHWLVDPNTKSTLVATAKELRISAASLLDAIAANLTLEDGKLTVSWTLPTSTEELPIDGS